MVMEYCDGGDLYKILIEKPIYLTNRDRFQIARDSAIGLRNMHAEGILNRDVKMENVITFRGDDRLIHSKLTDMGFACGRDDFEERKKPCGSLEYQSPERATALKSNDSDEVAACTTEANDVWPLGMVFYTLFHPGKSALRFHYQVCANRQGGLSLIAGLQQDAIDREIENSGMNPQFIPLVKGMLKVDPVHRFSMVQVVQELDRIKPFFEFPNSL
jgi:serine/threonine protein kinase